MAGLSPSPDDEAIVGINVTPLVDITLVLLAGLLILVSLLQPLATRLRLPASVLLAVVGISLGAVSTLIARTEAGVVGWRAHVRSHDDRVILAGRNNHAYAVVLAALVFTQQRKLAGVEEIGVGIEHAKHARDGALINGLVDVHRFSVVRLNDIEHSGKIADRGLVVVGRSGRRPHRRTVDAPKDRRYTQYHDYED